MQGYIIKTDGFSRDIESELSQLGRLELISSVLCLYLLESDMSIDAISKIKNIISVRAEEEGYLIRHEKGIMYI